MQSTVTPQATPETQANISQDAPTKSAEKTNDVNYAALAALGFLVSGVVTISNCIGPYRGSPMAPLGVGLGAGMVLLGGSIDRKEKPTPNDYWNSMTRATSDAIEFVSGAFQKELPEIRDVIVPYLPPDLQSLAESLSSQYSDTEWLAPFRRRSHVVVGPSGSGKTQYLLSLVADCLQELQVGGKLLICDSDYGSSHEGTEPNNWLGLPVKKFIRTEYEEIYAELLSFHAEMEDRLRRSRSNEQISKPTWRLVIDEWIGFVAWVEANLEKKEFEVFINRIGDLLRRGLKQRVVLVLGTQNLYTTSCKLPQALIPEFNILLLGDGALQAKNLGYLRFAEGETDETLKTKVLSVRKAPNCKYAAICQMANEAASIKVVPTLNTNINLVLPTEEPTDEIQLWWDELSPEFKREFQNAAVEYAKAIAAGSAGKKDSRLGSFAKALKLEQRSTNPKYQKLREEWRLVMSVVK
jgi:hypothetical protein